MLMRMKIEWDLELLGPNLPKMNFSIFLGMSKTKYYFLVFTKWIFVSVHATRKDFCDCQCSSNICQNINSFNTINDLPDIVS